MAIMFTVTGETTLDEDALFQDDDVSLATLQGAVSAFYNRLFTAGGYNLSTAFPSSVGVSRSSNTFITVSATGQITNFAFTDMNGDPLVNANSGIDTLSGFDVRLYTDPTNDNIVIGRAGPNGDATDPIVYAAYLQEVYNNQGALVGLAVWQVTLVPMFHPNTGNPDDRIDIDDGVLFVTAEGAIEFNLGTLASGQNNWNAFGDASSQIIVIADEVATGQTVNTSQGGGSTTIGNSNQMIDGVNPAKDPNGEAMVFTFVKDSGHLISGIGANQNYGDPSTINYSSLLDAGAAEWSISQTQGGSPFAVAKITALSTAKEVLGNFVPGLSNDGMPITIDTVTIKSGTTVLLVATRGSDPMGDPDTNPNVNIDEVSRTVGKGGNAQTFNLSVTFNADGSATISGLVAKDSIAYTTTSDHNRLVIQNVGAHDSTLPFDIGGFRLLEADDESVDISPRLNIDDSGPTSNNQELGIVHEDALKIANGDSSDGIEEMGATQTTMINDFNLALGIVPGTDAPALFALTPGNFAAPFTSKGQAVTYVIAQTEGGGTMTKADDVYTLTAVADFGGANRTVFVMVVNSDGTGSFRLRDQVDHVNLGDNGTLTVNFTSYITATDAEGDPATLTSGFATVVIENDVPANNTNVLTLHVDEDELSTTIPPGDAGDASNGITDGDMQTDEVTAAAMASIANLATSGADENLTWAFKADVTALNALGLQSKDRPVTWNVNMAGDTLTAIAGGTVILTVTLAANGAVTVDLDDQFDHDTGPAGLFSGMGDERILTLDLSGQVMATDHDGDSLTLDTGSFRLEIENDVPTIGPISNLLIDFTTINGPNPNDAGGSSKSMDTTSLNAVPGADEPLSFVFTSSFTTDTSVIAGLLGARIENNTRIVWYTNDDGVAGFNPLTDTLFFDATLNQMTGEVKFQAYENPPPALIQFDLSTLKAGIFRWNAFGDNTNQIIVSSDEAGQRTNTSKGGGPTTIAVDNQLINGIAPNKDANGNALVFTFVKDSPGLLDANAPAQDYTNIDSVNYTSLFNATSAQWSISQTQGGAKFAVATMTALSTDKEVLGGADGFFGTTGGYHDDDIVFIDTVIVKNGNTVLIEATRGSDPMGVPIPGVDINADPNIDSVNRVFGSGQNPDMFLLTVTFNADGTATISGLREKDSITYTTDGDHNRLKVQNTGLESNTLPFDIGGFALLQVQPTPDQRFTAQVAATDNDGDTVTSNVFNLDVDGTGVFDNDMFGV